MTAAELNAKFTDLAGRAVTTEAARRIAATVAKLERVDNSRELTHLLCAAAPR